MQSAEASFTGTFRMILVLLALWVVVRWFLRQQGGSRRAPTRPESRPKGDVRIEHAPNHEGIPMDQDRIVDADFEEIK
ncbi:MAG: hypothetical protein H6591_14340 [Flavobacteriales bacterium]|nr:hypothetical protein [Flavobacteriales bacterium]